MVSVKISLTNFHELNISSLILNELTNLGFIKMTSIQKICIPPSLKGFDVLGSAKTGSGKTLCFVLPTIQKMHALHWNSGNSIFCITLAPTRELCMQLFNFFNKFSKFEHMRVGIRIGGKIAKKIKLERKNYNLLIATPGCLVKTILETKSYIFDFLRILTIDEADRLLDMGFKTFFDIICKNIPKRKQVFLFSATLNSKLKNLARLNLTNPFYGCIMKKYQSQYVTGKEGFPSIPSNIFQYYSILINQKKIDILQSFLLSHTKRKILVFFSTKKQVKFFYAYFKKLNFNLYFIYGNLNQNKRVENFIGFSRSKNGILFTTDLMSRGIDFRSIDWIIQADCPENIKTYLHRIGRTGRFLETGKAVLLLKSNEINFLNILKIHSVQISKINFNRSQVVEVGEKINKLIKQNRWFYKMAYEAFFSYARFILMQKNKNIFDLRKIKWSEIANEFGIKSLVFKAI